MNIPQLTKYTPEINGDVVVLSIAAISLKMRVEINVEKIRLLHI